MKARPGPESLGIHGLTTASRRTPLRSAAEAEHGWAAEDCIFPQSWQSFAPAGGGSCHGPTRGSSRPPGRAVVSVLSLRRRRLNLAVGRRMTVFLPVMAVFCTGSGGRCHGPTRGSSRPPGRAVGSVLSSRRRRLNLAVGRRRTAFSPGHGNLLHQQAALVAMAQHGVPADRMGVRLGVFSRQDGGG